MVGHAPCSYVYVLMCVGDASSAVMYMHCVHTHARM